MSEFELSQLRENAYIHMVGIGGISMSALAYILRYFNYRVSGSDRGETEIISRLRKSGIDVAKGHSTDNIKNPDLVCYTAAIPQDNPELIRAREMGIPTMERAELLGQIMKHYKLPIAVAGTHGKTTTTSMIALILLSAALEPTILVGGELAQIGGNFKIGKENYLVFEACEYVESFLHFHPYMSIITNIDADHLDYFKDLNHIISSFGKFARLNSPNGCIIVCSDDKNALSVVQNIETKTVKYGIISRNADYFADNIHVSAAGQTEFDVYKHGEPFVSLAINVHGKHNVCNALAAVAAADELGVDAAHIKAGLEEFSGTKRRFEKVGEVSGFTVMDDYAHHPTEIEKTLEAAKEVSDGDIWCIFQPHTYSRTKLLLDDFARALKNADRVIIADIYPAREKYDGTIHSCDLAAKIPGCVYMNDFGAIERYVLKYAKPGDTVITMGAGDVYKIGRDLVGEK